VSQDEAESRRPRAASRAASVQRIGTPAIGEWRYRAVGTRAVGAAGSDTPFDEEAAARVESLDGDGRSRIRVTTTTSFATLRETRAYAPRAIDAVELDVSAAGLSYGGRFDPAQRLVSLPAKPGTRTSSTWTAGGLRGRTDTEVVGTRTVEVDGRAEPCVLVDRRTTTAGDLDGTQRQRTCWSIERGMPLTDRLELSGTYRGIPFRGDLELRLLSAPPGSDRSDVADRSDRLQAADLLARQAASPTGAPSPYMFDGRIGRSDDFEDRRRGEGDSA
jgi:hypothetical protein